jgi:hypothetical protein
MFSIFVIIVLIGIPNHYKSDGEWIQLFLDHYGVEWQDEDMEDLIYRLNDIANNPYPVRELTIQKLAELPFLTEILISEILHWITINELLTHENLARSQLLGSIELELINYFVAFDTFLYDNQIRPVNRSLKSKLKKPLIFTDFKFKTTYPTAIGYKGNTPYYLGNSFRLEDRLWISESNYSMHLSRSKLPGENMDYPLQSGFSSFHLKLSNPLTRRNDKEIIFQVREVLIGDFQIRMGHGLIARNGTMRVGTESLSNQSGLLSSSVPYRSTTSGKFLRGIATQFSISNTDFQLFYSVRDLSTSTFDENMFYLPGWISKRTTISEVERFRNISLSTMGFSGSSNFQIKSHRVNITTQILDHTFNQPILNRSGYLNSFGFEGVNSREYSTFISFHSLNWTSSLEFATGNSDNRAFLQRVNFRKDDLTAGFWFRYYSPGFRSVLGSGPAAFGGSTNESGVGIWLKYRHSRNQQFRIFADSYRSLIPRTGSIMPIYGSEQQVNYSRRLNLISTLELRVRSRSQLNGQIFRDHFEREYYNRQKSRNVSYRATFQHRPSRNIYIHSKVDYNINKNESGEISPKGIGVSQLIRYKFRKVDVYVSQNVFNTDDFSQRIFNYEYDLIQSLSIPSYYGQGQRSYFMIHLEPLKQIVIRFKVGYTKYFDRAIIGSGNDQTDKNYRYDYGFQLRLKI